jgi:hypothetical protein
MGFVKGQSGNPAGRKKGVPNKSTAASRKKLEVIIWDEIDQLPEHLNKLDPRDRVTAVARLLPYVLPKMTEIIEAEPTHEKQGIDYSKLSVEELETMYGLLQKAGA